MTPDEQHAAVLGGLNEQEQLARAAQPGGAWYREGRSVNTTMPLLSPAEMAALHPDEFEDWVFNAATTADAAHIVNQQPARVLAQLAGRRRIVERHAPVILTDGAAYCRRCPDLDHPDWSEAWPCDDYRDAGADLLPPDPATGG